MKTLVIVAALAVAFVSPASAQLYNPFNDALQAYQVDQSLNALAARTQQSYQASVNQGLNMINPGYQRAPGCNPYTRLGLGC